MKIIPNPPKYSTCWYCLSKIEGSHITDIRVQYTCRNHEPLIIRWYCNRKSMDKWYFDNLAIYIPKHFKLYWEIQNTTAFWLLEWMDAIPSTDWGFWDINKQSHRSFEIDWVLSQTPERLLSLLQMYRTFS